MKKMIQTRLRKILPLLLLAIMIPALTACGDYGDDFGYDFGYSHIFTDEDIQSAAEVVLEKVKTLPGCKLHNLRYLGDSYCMDEYFPQLDTAIGEHTYEQVIVFISDFRTPPKKSDHKTRWEPDREYMDFRWVLARRGSTPWEILHYGEDCLDV